MASNLIYVIRKGFQIGTTRNGLMNLKMCLIVGLTRSWLPLMPPLQWALILIRNGLIYVLCIALVCPLVSGILFNPIVGLGS